MKIHASMVATICMVGALSVANADGPKKGFKFASNPVSEASESRLPPLYRDAAAATSMIDGQVTPAGHHSGLGGSCFTGDCCEYPGSWKNSLWGDYCYGDCSSGCRSKHAFRHTRWKTWCQPNHGYGCGGCGSGNTVCGGYGGCGGCNMCLHNHRSVGLGLRHCIDPCGSDHRWHLGHWMHTRSKLLGHRGSKSCCEAASDCGSSGCSSCGDSAPIESSPAPAMQNDMINPLPEMAPQPAPATTRLPFGRSAQRPQAKKSPLKLKSL